MMPEALWAATLTRVEHPAYGDSREGEMGSVYATTR